MAHSAVSSMDSSVGFCHRCNGRTMTDGVTSAISARSMTSKDVVMLYDLEHAQQLLSGATLACLPESHLLLEPADQSGKSHTGTLLVKVKVSVFI